MAATNRPTTARPMRLPTPAPDRTAVVTGTSLGDRHRDRP